MARGIWILQELKKIIGHEYFSERCGLIEKRLREIAAQHDFLLEARGKGMLWGLEIDHQKIPDLQLMQSLKNLKNLMIKSGVLLSSWGACFACYAAAGYFAAGPERGA